MFSRRKFLTLSGLGLASAACGPTMAGTPSGVGADAPLPPSLARLESMRPLVNPIRVEEREARIEQARRLMGQHRLDGILLTGGTTMEYFTGLRWGLSERLLALVLPAQGNAFLVVPAFERDRANEQVAEGPLHGHAELLTWHEHEDPYRLVARGLHARGLGSGRLGIEETVRFIFSDGVAAAAPALELVSATPVTAGCRAVKDDHELELMGIASAATLKAYEAAYRAVEPGMTQEDFQWLVSKAHEQLGFVGGAGVQVGQYSALPHGSRQPQVIEEGAVLLIDGGCGVEGYRSDISRTFVLGKPTDKMRRVFDIVREAQDAALAVAAPGVPAEAVDAAAREVVVAAGYGPGYSYFTHRVGHGLGMDGHEWPYLVRGNLLPLEQGMTFSDEPGIYIPGEFGVRLEDDMVITADGARLLTPQSPSLEQPFG